MTPQVTYTVSVPSVPPLPARAVFAHYTVEDADGASYPRSVCSVMLADAVRVWCEMGTLACNLFATAYAEDADGTTEYHTQFDARTGTWAEWSGGGDDAAVPLGTEEYDAAPITTLLETAN